jgi:hypothetical protein
VTRHVWALEYRTKQKGWRLYYTSHTRRAAAQGLRHYARFFPTREFRIVKYVPEKGDA